MNEALPLTILIDHNRVFQEPFKKPHQYFLNEEHIIRSTERIDLTVHPTYILCRLRNSVSSIARQVSNPLRLVSSCNNSFSAGAVRPILSSVYMFIFLYLPNK